jgi:pimeloyl-ACP methyl ester carboxylesterase
MSSSEVSVWRGLAFEKHGDGVPVIFLHAMCGGRHQWLPICRELRDDIICCILIDLPGHGGSDGIAPGGDPNQPYSDRVAAAIGLLLDELKIPRPLIVGHSLGAAVATFLAAKRPVRGVLNIDQDMRLGAMAEAIGGQAESIRADFPAFWRQLVGNFGLESLPHEMRQSILDCPLLESSIALSYWDLLLDGTPAAAQAYAETRLRAVGAPYWALHGNDPGSDYDAWLKKLVTDARVIRSPGMGHYVHLANPGATAAIIRQLACAL